MRGAVLGLAVWVALTQSAFAAGAFHIEPKPSAGQSLDFADGHARIASSKAAGMVVLAVDRDTFGENEYPHFFIAIENKGATSTNFTSQDIAILTDAGAGRVLTVGDLQLLAKSNVDRQIRSARWRAFGSALSSAAAAMQDNSGTFDATATSFGNTTTIQGSYTPPSNNVYAQQAAANNMAQANRDGARAAASLPNEYAIAEKFGFRPLTITPAGQAFDSLPLDKLPRKATKLTISATVNGEVHVFEYQVSYLRQ